ncbi:MAG: cob(I)yrinic acid a,c-diamide adenosyltransferase [Caldilineales bacterium]|nr:cob(I)yrinic acid a,c-diamide adenosyltransferase [Caldilineales bacterium]
MKIYTKTGDLGETGLFGGRRVPKHHLRIDTYGTVDETNSLLGLAASLCPDPALRSVIERVQGELFELGADLATPADTASAHIVRVAAANVARLEEEIDAWEAELPPLAHFILPGGSQAGAAVHIARTVCRRAERLLTALAAAEPVSPNAQRYLNRLSDWLFVLARLLNHRLGEAETPWHPRSSR